MQNAGGRGLGPGAGPGNEREWDEFLAAIKVGHTYANVHTVTFGGGEIRGQLNDRDQKGHTGPPLFTIDEYDQRCSRRWMTARPNSAAWAPSTTRWSKVSAK